ncbi:Crp/Fnr family transcriptional regulator [Sphingomonas sp. ZT3P38]|uniref:Crp/Fnr family transcriptional regulator n=1 Tax=Parasphingomonas zepuensis TaxID=3096161 RepID=UPI002FC5CA3D
MQRDEACGFVRDVFACPADVAEQVVDRGRIRAFARTAVIVRQGDWLTLTYLLFVGRAHALLYGAEGQIVLLHEFGPGDLFGALGEADAARQDADIVAIDDIRTLTLEAGELVLLAGRYACVGLALSRMLLQRLRQATERMYERTALSAVGRVNAELLRQARGGVDLTIRPAPVIAELALRVATTRETASRAINALERRGIIRRDGDGLTVVAPHRLEEMIL